METFVFSSWCERILDGEVGDWSKSLIENSVVVVQVDLSVSLS